MALRKRQKCSEGTILPWFRLVRVGKHGIDFADAAMVFYDDLAVTIQDAALGEERFITIGMDARARVLVVVYTWREDRIRIISARKATPRERHHYESCL